MPLFPVSSLSSIMSNNSLQYFLSRQSSCVTITQFNSNYNCKEYPHSAVRHNCSVVGCYKESLYYYVPRSDHSMVLLCRMTNQKLLMADQTLTAFTVGLKGNVETRRRCLQLGEILIILSTRPGQLDISTGHTTGTRQRPH